MIRQSNNQVNHFNNIEHLDMVDIHRFITEPMEMSSPMFFNGVPSKASISGKNGITQSHWCAMVRRAKE